MSRQYHYLVAGFPELFIDDNKLSISSTEFRETLLGDLHPVDAEIIRLYFYRYDNENILNRLQDAESRINALGNFSDTDIDDIIVAVKDSSFDTECPGVPEYFNTFITAYKAEQPIIDNMSWELQLSDLYYQYVNSNANEFISKWFLFEQNLSNIITATQCRKYEIEIDNQLTGTGEINSKLIRSNAHDFGIDNDFPMLDDIIKACDEEDLQEFEKKIDQIKWNYLDEEVFFHYFSVEKLFSFMIKLTVVERWLSLDEETGRQLFKELLNNMESSYEFPEEFSLKK